VIGFTPARKGRPVTVPAEGLWYVQPVGPLNSLKLARLVKEMRAAKVPGLDLSDHWELTDEQLEPLRDLPALRLIVVARTRLGDAACRRLARLSGLRHLFLGENTTDAGLAALRPLEQLVELNLDRARITNRGAEALAHFPKLERLDLSSTRVTDGGLAVLARLSRLKAVVLNGLTTDAAGAILAKAQSLEELDLSQTQISGAGFEALARLPKLERLYVSRELTDRGLAGVAALHNLRSLDLSGTKITDRGLEALLKMTNLRELALTETQIGNAGLATLAKVPQLRILELTDTRITSDGLPALAKAPKLEILSVSWQKVRKEDVQNMVSLARLKSILFNGVALPDEVMGQLRLLAQLPPRESAGEKTQALEKPVEVAGLPAGTVPKPMIAPAPTLINRRVVAPSVQPVPAATPALKAATPKPSAGIAASKLPALPRNEDIVVRPAPAAPASRPSSKSWEDVLTKPSLKSAKAPAAPANPAFEPRPAVETPPEAAAKPSPAEVRAPAGTENILRAIELHSKSAGHAPVPRLAALRQLNQSGSAQALGEIIADQNRPDTQPHEDKPENSLGEIEINAR
jgi:Leucine-rich repeat (LRR) protein